MKERDKVRMEINIAGERIPLTVPFSQQEAVRDAERRVDDLFQSWSARYPGKQPKEILAMVAYQFSAHYGELLQQANQAIALADRLDDRLAQLLATGPQEDSPSPPDPFHMEEDFFTDF